MWENGIDIYSATIELTFKDDFQSLKKPESLTETY